MPSLRPFQNKPESQQAKQGLGESLFNFNIWDSVNWLSRTEVSACVGLGKMVLKNIQNEL